MSDAGAWLRNAMMADLVVCLEADCGVTYALRARACPKCGSVTNWPLAKWLDRRVA